MLGINKEREDLRDELVENEPTQREERESVWDASDGIRGFDARRVHRETFDV